MIKLHPEFITRLGKPEFAVLSIEEYEKLKEYLEDIEDLLVLRQAKAAEENLPAIGMEEMIRRLGI